MELNKLIDMYRTEVDELYECMYRCVEARRCLGMKIIPDPDALYEDLTTTVPDCIKHLGRVNVLEDILIDKNVEPPVFSYCTPWMTKFDWMVTKDEET